MKLLYEDAVTTIPVLPLAASDYSSFARFLVSGQLPGQRPRLGQRGK
jgi:hypothetical protein